ncbi:MAG TPA: class I SAM-dependent methyltransferase [Anaerolineae bacterium]
MEERQTGKSNYRPEWVAGYFDEFGGREWKRLVATPVDEVSLYIHTHYLRQYVPAGARVLEIGAGAGRFTQVLANLGVLVLVADISRVQLDLNRQHAQEYGFIQAVEAWHQVDMCDMAQFDLDSFDCVVAYGAPLSYVLDQRHVALRECVRVLKPGGTLLASVGALWGSAHRRLDGVLNVTPLENNQTITDTGDLTPETFPGGRHFAHMFRAGEFRDFLTQAGLTILALSASNCLSLGWEDLLAEIREDDAKWQELLRMELEACAEPGCLDMGTHLIGVARKAASI